MTKQEALQIIWDYMHMGHELKKADLIFVLGNRDLRVAEYASDLFLEGEGWAPYILFSGSGDIHNEKPGRERFQGSTEAEVFAEVARNKGVPEEAILIENKSQNTGENYQFSRKLLEEQRINPTTVIAVQKPYTERRAYATGKVQWPDVELIVTSPPIVLENYSDGVDIKEDWLINGMVGDLQRIKEYPKQGFQIEQDIPERVWKAYEFLTGEGYTKRLIV